MPYPLLLASSQRRLMAQFAKRTTVLARVAFSTQPAQEMESFLSGTSSLYAEQMHEMYEQDPNSVHSSWKKYFDNEQEGVAFHQDDYSRPTTIPSKRALAGAVRRVEEGTIRLLLFMKSLLTFFLYIQCF
jgi:hypothetical protein